MNLSEIGFHLLRPLLEHSDAERAHGLTLAALQWLPVNQAEISNDLLAARFFNIQFPNPVGLAAGFDKNGLVIDQMLSLGFGFVEAGTTTPLPQVGNAKPRLFRLAEDDAVINRMGFNNQGHDAMHAALMNRTRGGIVGVNLGANRDSPDRFSDYAKGVAQFAAVADYLTINISSPNTPGLRDMQARDDLDHLLNLIAKTQNSISRRAPILLKLAPDLSPDNMSDIANVCFDRVDGVIIGNTTLGRDGLRSPLAGEAGGLSGRPLYDLSTVQLAQFYQLTQGRIPLIGVGGICDAASAWIKICAGASLLQLYTALVYAGPALVPKIVSGLAAIVAQNGLQSYSDAIGVHAKEIADGYIPHHTSITKGVQAHSG
jgi:dihydroorotate dehydrogenase